MRPAHTISILTFVNIYLPGYKAGGPLQSIANLAERLGDAFQFKIITTDRDYGDSQPYAVAKPGEWQPVGRAEVLYLGPGAVTLQNLRRIMKATDHDVLYLNSLFNRDFTIRPLFLWQMGLVPRKPLVLAPRGEFSPGALGIKKFRKRFYLAMVRALGFYDNVTWQASSPYEAKDIEDCFRGAASRKSVIVAPDLLSLQGLADSPKPVRKKKPGSLSLVFASRISPKKNLIGALQCLSGLRGAVQFNVYGPIDDHGYWAECQQAIKALPSNVHVAYQGPIPHERVVQELAQHDLFFLPTLGENFGHAIVEALSSGCPILISDQTPWRNLEALSAGWDLPLNGCGAYRAVLQRCLEMDESEHRQLREGALALAEAIARDDASLLANRELFLSACQRESSVSARISKAEDLTDENKRHFDKLACLWEEKFEVGGKLHERGGPFVHFLRQKLGSAGRVLDFGCGPGNITNICKNAGYLMQGVDLSEVMIERARRRSKGQGIGFSVLESAEPLDLPFEPGSFDAVISSSVLEYVSDPLDCLKELSRVAAPGGFLILTVPNMLHPQRWLEACLCRVLSPDQFETGSKWQLYTEYLRLSRNRLRLKHWIALLREAGWQVETVNARNTSLVMLVAVRVSEPWAFVSRREVACPVASQAS